MPRKHRRQRRPKDRMQEATAEAEAAVRAGADRLRARVERVAEAPTTWFTGEQELPKISGRVIELAEPISEAGDGVLPARTAISFATLAWNLSLLPEDVRRRELRAAAKEVEPDSLALRFEFQHMVSMLVRRKRELFPEDERFIMDYELVPAANGHTLTVMCAMPPEDEADDAENAVEGAGA